jgi:hypothetical protein
MNSLMKRALVALTFVSGTLVAIPSAWADPLPGRDIEKFIQLPMDGTLLPGPQGTVQPYWGHDEFSTAYGVGIGPAAPVIYQGRFMADDFADEFRTPVVHVKWWGSYLNNILGQFPIDKFLISFEEDVPVSATNPFSHPGKPLLNQIVRRVPVGGLAPGSGTYTEKPISLGGPPLSETLYEYNAELHLDKPFRQLPDTVYWLKIVALVDLPPGVPIPNPNEPSTIVPRWGWHNRDFTIKNPLASPNVLPGETVTVVGPVPGGFPVWHFQDDAVTGRVLVDTAGPMGQIMPVIQQDEYLPTRYLDLIDGPPPIGQHSKDLAFVLYTVPEPATSVLMLAGLAGALVVRRRPGNG